MNTNIKNYLGWALILMVVVFALSALKTASAFDRSSRWTSSASFAVTGEGKVVAIPDVARLSIGVLTEGGPDAVALQKENTKKVNAIIAFVKGKGVASDDIKTEQYSVSPRYEYANCGYAPTTTTCPPPKIVGYTISQSISVKVRNFDVTGDILSGAVSAGANNVYGPTFEVDDASKLINKARAEALTKARESAESLARAGDFKLGKIFSIDESSGYPRTFSSYGKEAYGGDAMMSAVPAPSIEPGSTDISVTVSVRYEIR